MKIIFSRKGFDSTSGGGPSPIVKGLPISLPIPGQNGEATIYSDLGLGQTVTDVTRGRIGGDHPCHDDPMFADGHCWFGQSGAAEGHLRKQGVGEGDVFLFFGLFADAETQERHHRIFGQMRIACHGTPDDIEKHTRWKPPPRPHPHSAGEWGSGNAIYHGPGTVARRASPCLRLTRPGGPLNSWIVPRWLRHFGLSYHAMPERWRAPDTLESARRGQEFVCDIGDAEEPRRWLDAIIAQIENPN